MEAISKQAILDKTHYGLNIYSHILQSYYPGAIILSLSGRTCAPARNPFNNDKPTLQVFIEKENVLGNSLDSEFAKHTDTENAIAAGDAFSFAELHYKQGGDELLQILNKELHLRIGEERSFYRNNSKNSNQGNQINSVNHGSNNLFSFFKAPISNTKPHSETTLRKVYNAIVGNYYKDRTEKLRAISDVQQARKFKAANFDYCTFSGVFTSRNDKALVKHSGLLCVDFDHLKDIETLFKRLLNDEYFDTQLLFRSPSGDGLKWIIPVSPLVGDLGGFTHGNYFASVVNYILQTYGIEVDKSGRDISRACFLPHDPRAFINPQFLK